MSPLRGRVVLVTGAARGIGEAVAREVAARGGQLALVGLEPERLHALWRELSTDEDRPHFWAEADVTDQAALAKAVAGAVERLQGIDIVVANAGIANTGTVATSPPDALARTVEVNLIGVMRTVSAALPQVLEARGHFLLVASAASFATAPGLAAYCAAKAGVEAFGDALRLEVAHQGVTVGTAHPIWVDTDLVRDARSDLPIFRQSMASTPGPLGRQVDVQTCARLIVDGIERRQAKVFVPRSVGWAFHARALLTTPLARKVMQREAARSVPALEEQVRRLGRAFGAHSVESTRPGPWSPTAPETSETLETL